ncbi:MAG: ETEC_3214 domain-containing protein [Kangiellaceae bacterium]|jgi:hypothetical protein|nr:ETEC_3214 domain-containing protein [Kangiellaceae bacterium]
MAMDKAEEVAAAQKEERHESVIDEILSKLPTSFVTVILLFVALGNFNDSFEVINRFFEFGRSLFSNEIYYERITNVKVNLNARYLERSLGEPQLIKRVGEDLDANYYFDDQFMLVFFERQERVEGYYVMSFNDSFQPSISLDEEDDKPLWSTPFDEITASTDGFGMDFSKNNSYYLESTSMVSNGLSLNIYLGWSSVANENLDEDLYADLEGIYEADLMGSDDLIEKVMVFRATYSPNFYGYGNFDVAVVEESMLTNSELLFYAGIN